eukprot:8718269-Alexandrium_andersonii.AAC.1
MSASLVGSEMCIRDSANASRGFLRLPGAPPTPADPWLLPPAEQPPKSESVSYTHLTLPTICSV